MKKIFEPKSIAVIGASAKKGKVGNIILKNLSLSKKCKLFPINSSAKNILGLKAYPSVLDVEDQIDLAIIAIPAQFVADVIKECAWHSNPISNIVIISAGFSEIGHEGQKREDELLELAQRYNLNIIGPNCLGIINTNLNLNASFAKSEVPKGKIGLIAQSGAFTTSMFDLLGKHGLGFSLVATLGNKTDVNENDLLEFYAKDPQTKIIAMYLEDIADGKGLMEDINKIAPKKPVVIIKAGTSKKARDAIQSHTGAMAGDADVIKEAIRDNGGIICENFPDFVGTLKLLNGFQKPRNGKTLIVTNAGGPGVVATDLASSFENLELYSPSTNEQKTFAKLLPAESSVKNPIDVLGDAFEDRYANIFKASSKISKIGSVCVIVTPQAQTPIEKIAEQIKIANKQYKIPFIPIIIGGEAYNQAAQVLNVDENGPFTFPFIALRSLSKYVEYVKQIENHQAFRKVIYAKTRSSLVEKLTKQKRSVLLYNEAREIGKKQKLNIAPGNVVENKKQLKKIRSGFPLVAKIDSPSVLHKNAKNGISLNISSAKQLAKEYARLKKLFKNDNVLVQRQLPEGLELIMGVKKDNSFGHVLMLGLGGIFTEIFNLKHLWVLPTSQKQIEKKLARSPLGEIIEKNKIEISKVAKEAEKVGKIVSETPQIKELDVNPIILYPDKKPVVVDIKILLDKN